MDTIQTVEGVLLGLPYIVMVAFAATATLFPGIPEEVFLLVIGYLIGAGSFQFLPTALFLILGFLIMDSALFALARRDLRVLKFLQEKLLGKEDTIKRGFLKKHVDTIVFVSRFAFFVRWIGPITAGRLRVSWKRFLWVDIIALCIYVPLMLIGGMYFSTRIEIILDGINTAGNIVSTVMVLVIAVSLLVWLRKKFLRRLRAWARGEVRTHQLLGFRWRSDR